MSRRESAALGLGVVFLAWLALQLVPVPQSLIESIAPATARLNRISVPGAGSSDPRGYAFPVPSAPADGGASLPVRWILPDRAGPRPLSLHPYATYRVLCQSAALVGCLLMMLVLFRGRRAERVATALALAAGLQAAYGLAESMSGHQHIFLYAKRYYTESATGTLINRNHFAAMLNMALPLVAALMIRGRPRIPPEPGAVGRRERLARMVRRLERPALGVTAILLGLAVVLSRSRAGIASMAAGLIALMLLAWRRPEFRAASPLDSVWRRRIAVSAPALLLALILFYSLAAGADGALSRFRQLAGDLKATAARPALWSETLPLTTRFGWLGAGAGAFPYAVNPHLSELPLTDFYLYDHAHSDYLEAVVTLGAAGLAPALLSLGLLCAGPGRTLAGAGALAGLATLVIHSAFDFPLAVPSNALMALALVLLAAGRQGAPVRAMSSSGRRASATRLRRASAAIVLVAVAVWPARSLAAAIVFRPHAQSEPSDPQAVRALGIAERLEPFNDAFPRARARGLLQKADVSKPRPIDVGDDLQAQVAGRSRERLEAMEEAYRALLRCLALSPVDYSLHADLAESVSRARGLARDAGLDVPGDGEPGSPLAAPGLASIRLAPTDWGNRAAMAGLLWRERRMLHPEEVALPLETLSGALGRPGVEAGWIDYLLATTRDAASLAVVDRALAPPSAAWGALLRGSGFMAPDARRCAALLQQAALLRETEASLRSAAPSDAVARRRDAAAALEALLATSPEAESAPCGPDAPDRAVIRERAEQLLGAIRRESGPPQP